VEDEEVGQKCFQCVTFALPPLRIQGTLPHLGHGHERDDQLSATDNGYAGARIQDAT
jgi:hypothetical protein